MCRKLFLSSTVIFVLLSLVVVVEADSLMWTQTYGGTNDDQAYSLVETSDGGYAIVGYARSFGFGKQDFWLVKTDTFGYMEWNQTYGGIGDDVVRSLVSTSDGGYALAGYTYSFGAGNEDFWLIKTDEYGNIEWNQTYGGGSHDVARSLIETSDGGYALTGFTQSFGNGQAHCWLVKTDATGNMQWNCTYGKIDTTYAFALVETSDGGYHLAGGIYYDDVGTEFLLIKTDGFGIMEWNQTYGGMGHEQAHALIATSDGGYAIAGETNSYGAGSNDSWSYDYWLIKTDEGGDIPEYFSWLLPSIMLTATLVIVIYKKMQKRMLKNTLIPRRENLN